MTARVLVVDDEAINRLVLEQILLTQQCEVFFAADGCEAIEKLAHEAFDLVLLDIHMPAISGLDVIEQLRLKPGPNQGVQVVAVTADTSRLADDYIAVGFDGYLNKPVSVTAIANLVNVRGFDPAEAAAA